MVEIDIKIKIAPQLTQQLWSGGELIIGLLIMAQIKLSIMNEQFSNWLSPLLNLIL